MSLAPKSRSRGRRWLKRTMLGVGLGVVIIALATLRPIDRGPWLQTEPALQALGTAATMQHELADTRNRTVPRFNGLFALVRLETYSLSTERRNRTLPP